MTLLVANHIWLSDVRLIIFMQSDVSVHVPGSQILFYQVWFFNDSTSDFHLQLSLFAVFVINPDACFISVIGTLFISSPGDDTMTFFARWWSYGLLRPVMIIWPSSPGDDPMTFFTRWWSYDLLHSVMILWPSSPGDDPMTFFNRWWSYDLLHPVIILWPDVNTTCGPRHAKMCLRAFSTR